MLQHGSKSDVGAFNKLSDVTADIRTLESSVGDVMRVHLCTRDYMSRTRLLQLEEPVRHVNVTWVIEVIEVSDLQSSMLCARCTASGGP